MRLSRNIFGFLGRNYVNSGVMPAMVATAQAFGNEELDMKSYLECLYEELAVSQILAKREGKDSNKDGNK